MHLVLEFARQIFKISDLERKNDHMILHINDPKDSIKRKDDLGAGETVQQLRVITA